MLKSLILIVSCLILSGCSGFGSEVGYCNIVKLEAEAPIVIESRKKLEDQMLKVTEMSKTENQQAIKNEIEVTRKLEESLNKEVKEKVSAAMASVRKKNNLSAIIDARAVYDGGKDVTDEILAELKK